MQLSDGEDLNNIVLRAPIGICILQADTLVAEIVNDKFLEVAGKPYEAIYGHYYWDAFAEARQYYEPALANVVKTGEPYYANEVELMLIRQGKQEMVFVTFVYAPAENSEGKVTKIAIWVFENTKQVNERQAAEAAKLAFQMERDRLKRFFMQAPAGICILNGPNLIYELVNPGYQQLLPGRELLGRSIFDALPELVGTPLQQVLLNVYHSGEPYDYNELLIPVAEYEGGPTVDRYFSFNYQARRDENEQVDGILAFVFEVTSLMKVRQQQTETNEELASLNEELAATNEEGQAANEELTSANEQLSVINEELTSARDMGNKLLQQVEASETRFRFILNAIPQQVWTASPDGALDYVNQVVCDDFGYTTDEIVGHGWQAFIHPDDLPGCLEKWINALATGTEYVTEFRLKFKDGQYRWHLARAVPFAEGNQIKLWLGTNTNIDLQKQNEQRKDEFLSIASHELKTPLTSIKAYNQIIQRIDDPEKLKPFIRKSADHIVRLERLISDLLDVTKINAGKMNYVLETINIKTLLKDSIEGIQHSIPSHQIILESAPDIDYTGDQLRLEQVIHNFLTNAAKYSPDAKTILVNSKADQGNIIVSIQDFGIGIARENLDRLFDRYYRVDNTAMRFEGLGLGLFISAEILRKHGGSFWIESELGKGSTFYFRLPLKSADKPQITRTETFYRDQHLTINFNQTKKRLEVDWTGFQDLESVKHGCILMWEFLQKNHCDRVVNDNTHVMGNWSEATDWVGNIWFPMMEQAGLKYFAHVFSPSTFSQLAAIKSIDIMAGIITTQYFTEIKLAEDWIDQQ